MVFRNLHARICFEHVFQYTRLGGIVRIHISTCCQCKVRTHAVAGVTAFEKSQVQVHLSGAVMVINETRHGMVIGFAEILQIIRLHISTHRER
ncbi:hypothetical protein D3C87_1983100 [compost metagenome]